MLLVLAMSAVTASTTPAEAAPAHPWPPAMKLEDAAKGRLRGIGTEPFWGIRIDGISVPAGGVATLAYTARVNAFADPSAEGTIWI